MILEDYTAEARGKFPTNYQNILDEYDVYHNTGGNSYVTQKVEEYKRWFAEVQKQDVDSKK
jgi:hydroxypyruvate isomerase